MADIKGLMTSNRDDWETPQSFFDDLHAKYHFTLDAASSDENAKLTKHYTRKNSGLDKHWEGERVFCNPPYGSEIKHWARKCAEEAENGTFIVMLVPARTDTAWFHDNIYNNERARFELLRGRIKFELGGIAQGSSTFPSMLVFFNDGSMDDSKGVMHDEGRVQRRNDEASQSGAASRQAVGKGLL